MAPLARLAGATIKRIWLSASPSLTLHRSRPFSSSHPAASHIGKAPVAVPSDVSLFFNPTSTLSPRTPSLRGSVEMVVKGPLGEARVDVLPFVRIALPAASTARTEAVSRERGTRKNAEAVVEAPMTAAEHVAAWSSNASASPPPPSSTQTPSSSTLVPILLTQSSPTISVSVDNSADRTQKAMWGLTRTLIANAIQGVDKGFTANVQLVGVGYRAELEDVPFSSPSASSSSSPPSTSAPQSGSSAASFSTVGAPRKRLRIKLGYSHDVIVPLPATSTFLGAEISAPTQIVLRSIDKREVGQLAADIRKWRKPEPYNGKGVFVNGETIRRKEVKKK